MQARIGIIGSGFAAAALLLHLHKQGQALSDVLVIGDGALGRGQAYGAATDCFRLNVRANLQRLWADDPNHFEDWAAHHIDDPDGSSPVGHFYRRHDFAAYLQAQLAAMSDGRAIRHLRARATAIGKEGHGWRVHCAGYDAVMVDKIVLATGNPEPEWPVPDVPCDPHLVKSPWNGAWVPQVPMDARVVIIGAGLTAMDAVHVLDQQGHCGTVTLIAPHGMLPPVQTGWQPRAGYEWPIKTDSAAAFLREMRRHLGAGSWHDQAWQERFEQLRVGINEVWMRLSARDRAKLLRRVGWLWSLLRFRAGPQAVQSAGWLLASGRMTIQTGRLSSISATDEGWRCDVRAARGTEPTSIMADYVINCTGMGRDELLDQMLQAHLVARSGVANAPLIAPDLRLAAPDGTPHDNLFMIGPGTGHDLGDVVGSASIARQAAAVTTQLVD